MSRSHHEQPEGSQSDDDYLDQLLAHGELEVLGRLTEASNATLLAEVTSDGRRLHCVYKPIRGERPLWDFPHGTLAAREVASYRLSHAAGLNLVPPTVLRDGPFGRGSVQLWIQGPADPHSDDLDEDPSETPTPDDETFLSVPADLVRLMPVHELPSDWHPVVRAQDEFGDAYVLAHADDDRLRDLAVLDVVLNNADRKGAHILTDAEGTLRGVDHGLTFNLDDKLRTVLWGWAGDRLREQDRDLLAGLAEALDGALGESLSTLLEAEEIKRAQARVRALRSRDRMPRPAGDWPAIPWPPF